MDVQSLLFKIEIKRLFLFRLYFYTTSKSVFIQPQKVSKKQSFPLFYNMSNTWL